MQFDVTVEESLTGRRQNTSAQVLLHRHKYKMELIKTREYFKPGLKYVAQVFTVLQLPYNIYIHFFLLILKM